MTKKEKKEKVIKVEKTLHNTTASKAENNIPDIEFYGNGDMWKLLSKASSKNEQWLKSSKAMQIAGVGCAVQVTTQQGDNIAEAVTFIPGVKIKNLKDAKGVVIGRELVKF